MKLTFKKKEEKNNKITIIRTIELNTTAIIKQQTNLSSYLNEVICKYIYI